jgi:uncharacterized protein (TIGR03089 family)
MGDRAAAPPQLLARLLASDPTRPRLTWYDDAEGPTRGERIELSGRVVATWTAKAASLLVDDLDVTRGDTVALQLPPHWRAVYWALAAWTVGAVVRELPPRGRDHSTPGLVQGLPTTTGASRGDPAPFTARVVVTDQPGEVGSLARSADAVVAVSLPALARAWAGGEPLPDGATDEAAEIGTHPDVFEPYDPPEPDDDAIVLDDVTLAADELLDQARSLAVQASWRTGERVGITARTGEPVGPVLLAVLAAWSVDGSVVLVRDADPAVLPQRWDAERVTSAWPPAGSRAPRP